MTQKDYYSILELLKFIKTKDLDIPLDQLGSYIYARHINPLVKISDKKAF